jgi:TetR/AcrR family transcriptional regulator, repressor for uid operon
MSATARLLQLALDNEVEPPADQVAEKVMDAALALVAASGVQHLTMDDVAARAGVGRMTVYRRFGSRDALVEALSVRECRRCLVRVGEAIAGVEAPDERLAKLFVVVIREVRTHPLLARLARVEPEVFLAEMTASDSAIMRMATGFVVGVITEGQARGEIVHVDPQVLAEIWVRVGASFVLMPDSVIALDDEQATLTAARQILGTYVLG